MTRAAYSLFPLASLAAFGAALAAADPRDIVRQSIARHGLQTAFPTETVPKPESWWSWLGFNLSADMLRVLLWGAVLLGVAIIVWSLRDSLPVFSRSRKISAPEPVRAGASAAARLDEARLEAEDLAGQGQYGEAMHLLLLKSLAEIRLRLGIRFAASLTSREILRRVPLSEIGRAAFAAIVHAVEATYYGGRPASREDYVGCRDEFDALRRSLAGAATG